MMHSNEMLCTGRSQGTCHLIHGKEEVSGDQASFKNRQEKWLSSGPQYMFATGEEFNSKNGVK
jgi:hypothetical protein